MAAAWLLVVAAAAAGLRLADALPRAVLGVPRGVVRAGDVAEIERMTGRRMPVPAYYPDRLAWPPADARVHSGGSAAIWCRERAGTAVALIVATAPPGAPAIAPEILPAAVELQREAAPVAGRVTAVARVRDGGGVVWHQVEWRTPDQIILIRYRGTLDELLKIAGSVHE